VREREKMKMIFINRRQCWWMGVLGIRPVKEPFLCTYRWIFIHSHTHMCTCLCVFLSLSLSLTHSQCRKTPAIRLTADVPYWQFISLACSLQLWHWKRVFFAIYRLTLNTQVNYTFTRHVLPSTFFFHLSLFFNFYYSSLMIMFIELSDCITIDYVQVREIMVIIICE
jgi:hypothetical protein